MWKRVALALLVVLVVLVVAGRLRERNQPPPSTSAATLIRTGAAPDAGTPDGRLYLYNARERPGEGVFDAYVATGHDAARLRGHRLLPRRDGNRGAADVTDDGRYVLLVTARGADRADSRSQPGKGFGNAIEIYDRETRRLATIVRGGCGACVRGLIWPRFSPDTDTDTDGAGAGRPRAVHWSEMIEPPWRAWPFGRWRQHVTTLAWQDGAPSAAADRTWQHPDGKPHIYETYGWIPGTDRLVFMSDNDVPAEGRGLFHGQLFTLPESAFTEGGAATVKPRRFTAPFRSRDGSPQQANHEFAHFHPDHPGWLYTSVAHDSKLGTMDLWRYRYDRAGDPTGERRRVTYFGGTKGPLGFWRRRDGFPQPAFRVVGGMTPARDGGWVAGVCRDIVCERIDAYRLPGR